jgi:hypothetical protein
MFHPYETSEGTIEGLYLPRLTWDVLYRENIQTLDRVAAPGEQLSGDGQLSVWGS